MPTITTADFKKGIYIEFRGEVWQMTEVQFVNPGKGSAFLRTRLKNIRTAKVLDFTFKSGEQVEEIPIDVSEMQYLYKDAQGFIFMNPGSYEQVSIPPSTLGDLTKYLKEGDAYQILIHDSQPLSVRTPAKVSLKVIHADEGAAGNTVSGTPTKPVTVETGATVDVPIFVKEGDVIIIRPETGEYLGRETELSS